VTQERRRLALSDCVPSQQLAAGVHSFLSPEMLSFLLSSSGESCSGKTGAVVKKRAKILFDPKQFLARVGEGKTISEYRKGQIVFSQGQVADSVFYIQQGKVKLTVVSEQGKEAVVQSWGLAIFSAKDA
jgi:CRP-like cAMP-binding protein